VFPKYAASTWAAYGALVFGEGEFAKGEGLVAAVAMLPNGGAVAGSARNGEEVGLAGPIVWAVVECFSTAASPGYVVPERIDSLYTIHHDARTPSLFSTQRPGSGPGDCSISSVGIGLYTFSLPDRSSATPTGKVSERSSLIGS
jgi:hypothetical protein